MYNIDLGFILVGKFDLFSNQVKYSVPELIPIKIVQ
jgi:hypothetical protein